MAGCTDGQSGQTEVVEGQTVIAFCHIAGHKAELFD